MKSNGISLTYCSISGEPCWYHSNDQEYQVNQCSDIYSKKPTVSRVWMNMGEWCNNASKSICDLKGYCPAKAALAYVDYGMMQNDKMRSRRGER